MIISVRQSVVRIIKNVLLLFAFGSIFILAIIISIDTHKVNEMRGCLSESVMRMEEKFL